MKYGINFAVASAFASTMIVGCPDPHVPDPRPDPNGVTCEKVCAHWRNLGCEEAEPTPDGASCVDVCESIQASSLPDDLECQAAVESCGEIDNC